MNRLERCAAIISELQSNLATARDRFPKLYEQLEPIIQNDARRMFRNRETRADAMQLVYLAVWRHIQNKPPPTTAVLLRMLIDGTLINAVRADSRAMTRDERVSQLGDAFSPDTVLEQVIFDQEDYIA